MTAPVLVGVDESTAGLGAVDLAVREAALGGRLVTAVRIGAGTSEAV